MVKSNKNAYKRSEVEEEDLNQAILAYVSPETRSEDAKKRKI